MEDKHNTFSLLLRKKKEKKTWKLCEKHHQNITLQPQPA